MGFFISIFDLMDEHIHIGKLIATVGLQGEVILKHVLGKKIVFKQGEVLFIETEKNIQLPYFIEKSVSKNNTETILKIEDLNRKEQAAKLLQKKIWLTKNDFEKHVSKTAPVNLIGFIIFNNEQQLGEVEAVIEQPQQILLQTRIQQKEVLIPLHEQTLKKIDRKKKQVHVVLPEGLLDVYLE
ncbi:MAG TPA: 16S rRNA processing protein RimM [Parafilimonas sp.]|nr:16S rRNA processing protein RimM [Parafilimonas sp.]